MSIILFISTLLLAGAIAGFAAGLLGVGGGIVMVPVLFTVFQLLGVSTATAMSMAVATSLAVIVPTSLSSYRSHRQRGNVARNILLTWSPFIAVGAVLGGIALPILGGRVVLVVFGIVALAFALNGMAEPFYRARFSEMPRVSVQAFFAMVTGFISALAGVGGGTFSVAIMRLFSVPTHTAVGTSALLGFFIALPSVLLMLAFTPTPNDAPAGSIGLVSWLSFLCVAPMSVVMAPLGAKCAVRLSGKKLSLAFTLFLFISGTRMLYKAWFIDAL